MSVVRGRPPGLAGGIRDASRAYCSSLSACPAPKSPTKARFSAVHMACLQERLLPSLNHRHGHSASSSVSTARASQTASQTAALLHGEEEDVFGDAGYTGADKRPEFEDRDVSWNIAVKRSIIKALPKALRELAEPVERALAQVRAWVEHPLVIVKKTLLVQSRA